MPQDTFHHLSLDSLDALLALQITVAWAGEQGEGKNERMGWWETMLLGAKAGVDVFRFIAPRTKLGLCCKAAREIARRTKETLRKKASEPEKVYSLFHLGNGIDFLLAEGLDALIHQQADLRAPSSLARAKFFEGSIEKQTWQPQAFATWLASWGTTQFREESVGRALPGADRQLAQDPLIHAQKFIGALNPLSSNYPFPHLRSNKGTAPLKSPRYTRKSGSAISSLKSHAPSDGTTSQAERSIKKRKPPFTLLGLAPA